MCEFFLRKLHFNKPPQRPQILQRRRPFPPPLGARVPSARVCAPPNLRAPSVCPILYPLTAEPFLQGCLKTCLLHKPHLPLCPSAAPRKPGRMAVTWPPDFMMHVCSPWRNYRQVPSGRSSNISVHFQPEMSLQVRQRSGALVGCVHHRFIVFLKVKTK